MGFSRIVDILIKTKKPMTGHHMIFDLAYIMNQFIENLPETYIEFAAKIHLLFPVIYDSRSLAVSINPNQNTSLKPLFDKIRKDKKFANNISFDLDKDKDPRFGAYKNEKDEFIG